MKIVALEEHLTTPGIVDALDRLPRDQRDDSVDTLNVGDVARLLDDLGDERLRMMDESGVDVQVLSLSTPGVQILGRTEAPALARDVNDLIGAMLCGRTGDMNLDDTALRPVFESAAALRVPLYIHPQVFPMRTKR